MEKILITGSNGLLGQSLLDLYLQDKEYQIIAVSRGVNRYPITDGYIYEAIDLTDQQALDKVVLKHRPDALINTAAMTNVDVCEDNKEECDAVNITLVKNLVSLASQINAYLVHISTDFVFDGKKAEGYYKETDKPNPLSYYGMSKLKSEEILKKSDIAYSILRTILVYGKVYDMSRNNIVLWIRGMLLKNKKITIVDDQFRAPTYVVNLALACKKAVEKKVKGTYSIASSELLSIYEIALEIAEVFNLDKSLIVPISTKTLNQKAIRPKTTGFNLEKSSRELDFKFHNFKSDLLFFKQKLI